MTIPKQINKQLAEIENKLGIKAYNEIMDFYYTLIRKIEDLQKSRDNWRNKFEELKNE